MKLDVTYKTFIQELIQKIYSTKNKAILSANRLMIELYFDIGQQIVSSQKREGWGKSVVEQMSKDDSYLAQAVRDISWGQNILIFEKCKDSIQRKYYIKNTIEFG